jgi:hypothetical protein
MIPTGGEIREPVQEVQQPSLTYRIDLTKGRVNGKVDGLDAVKQAVFKILQTERFRHLIYSFDYGVETNVLTGSSALLLRSELPRRIREALLQDDRISDVMDFKIEVVGDSASATFTVISDFGSFEREVVQGV